MNSVNSCREKAVLVVTLDVMLDTDVQAFVTYFAKSKKLVERRKGKNKK